MCKARARCTLNQQCPAVQASSVLYMHDCLPYILLSTPQRAGRCHTTPMHGLDALTCTSNSTSTSPLNPRPVCSILHIHFASALEVLPEVVSGTCSGSLQSCSVKNTADDSIVKCASFADGWPVKKTSKLGGWMMKPKPQQLLRCAYVCWKLAYITPACSSQPACQLCSTALRRTSSRGLYLLLIIVITVALCHSITVDHSLTISAMLAYLTAVEAPAGQQQQDSSSPGSKHSALRVLIAAGPLRKNGPFVGENSSDNRSGEWIPCNPW